MQNNDFVATGILEGPIIISLQINDNEADKKRYWVQCYKTIECIFGKQLISVRTSFL